MRVNTYLFHLYVIRRNNMNKIISFILLILVLTGCQKVGKSLHKTESIFEMDSDLIDKKSKRVSLNEINDRIDKINKTDITPNEKYLERNKLLNELILISNQQCNDHKGSIFFNQAAFKITTGTISNILSIVGTVANGTAIKSNLAAGAAFIGSTENLVSQEVYMKQLSQTVIIAIDSARAGYEANLKTGMGLDYDKYPIYAALTDLQEYHRRCSFYYGLVEISKALSNKKPTLKELNAKITELELSLSKSIKSPILNSSKHHSELIERLDQLKLERSKTYD